MQLKRIDKYIMNNMETTNTNKRDSVLFVRISDDEKAALEEVVAQQPEMTVSRFIREAAREKIAAINAATNQAPVTAANGN